MFYGIIITHKVYNNSPFSVRPTHIFFVKSHLEGHGTVARPRGKTISSVDGEIVGKSMVNPHLNADWIPICPTKLIWAGNLILTKVDRSGSFIFSANIATTRLRCCPAAFALPMRLFAQPTLRSEVFHAPGPPRTVRHLPEIGESQPGKVGEKKIRGYHGFLFRFMQISP